MTNLSDLNKRYRTSNATATAADITASKIAYINGGRVVGGGTDPTPESGFPSFYRRTSDADVVAGDIAEGKTAYGSSGIILGTNVPTPFHVATTTAFRGTQGTTLDISLSTSRAAGDLIIIGFANDSATPAACGTLAGYTRAGINTAGQHSCCFYWKILTGAEPTVTTLSTNPYFVYSLASAIVIRNVDQTTPINDWDSLHDRADTNVLTTPAITPTVASCLGVYWCFGSALSAGWSLSTPTDYTEIYEGQPRTGFAQASGHSDAAMVVSTPVSITATRADQGGTEYHSLYHFAIAPE